MKWGIRWETKHKGAGCYGAVIEGEFETRMAAEAEAARLRFAEPKRANPFDGGTPQPVEYIVFALAPGQKGLPTQPLLDRLRGRRDGSGA